MQVIDLNSRKQNFNSDWKFKLKDSKKWDSINLPHDWSIYFDFDHKSPAQNEAGLLNGGEGYYQKEFIVNNIAHKNIRICFDGVYMNSDLRINGHHIGTYPNGYTPFSYDITSFLIEGKNILDLKVENKQPSSRWYSGSGIYRDVSLLITKDISFKHYGIKITTPDLDKEHKTAVTNIIESSILNTSNKSQTFNIHYSILDSHDNLISETKSDAYQVDANTQLDIKDRIISESIQLWDIDNPTLYTLKAKIISTDGVKDSHNIRFGYRFMDFSPTQGFTLNGNYVKLHGVCMHHDQGALGAVANKTAMLRQLQMMKDMGANAIRMSHNPADDKFIEICEDIGLLLIDEAFDTWYGGKKQYDYGRFFDLVATHPESKPNETWAEYDLKQMVKRGMNSPAIIMWSVGNEIGESNNGDAKTVTTAANLNKWVKEIDTTRYTTMGQDVYRWAKEGGHEAVSSQVDIVGLNYAEDNYDYIRKKHPQWLIYGSETSSATRSRGVYAHPDEKLIHSNGDERKLQQSDYGNDHVSWGKTASESWIFDRDRQSYAGQFIWTGFDYIGEPTPWHNQNDLSVKSSYFGIVDTAGFKKNDYYFYQSQWLHPDDKAVLHILPHWNWDEDLIDYNMKTHDNTIPVRVYSNYESVELFLNGESLGSKNFNKKLTQDLRPYQEGEKEDQLYLEWRVPYIPGTLKAIATYKTSTISKEIKTALKTKHLQLKPEKHLLNNDEDLVYIEVNALDSKNTPCPTADHILYFEAEGNGEIVGVDNGNPASFERYQIQSDGVWKRSLFNGKALVIIKVEKGASFDLKVSSPGLSSDTCSIVRSINTPYMIPDIIYTKDSKIHDHPKQNFVNLDGQVGKQNFIPSKYKEKRTEDKIFYSDTNGKAKRVYKIQKEQAIVDTYIKRKINEPIILPSNVISINNFLQESTQDVIWPDFPLSINKPGRYTFYGSSAYDLKAKLVIDICNSEDDIVTDNVLTINNKIITSDLDKYVYELGQVCPQIEYDKENEYLQIIQANTINNYTACIIRFKDDSIRKQYIKFSEAKAQYHKTHLSINKNSGKVGETLELLACHYDQINNEIDVADYKYVISSNVGIEIIDNHVFLYEPGIYSISLVVTNDIEQFYSNRIQVQVLENTLLGDIQDIETIRINHDINTPLVLPSKIKASYQGFCDIPVDVTWSTIDSDLLNKFGNFEISGSVKNSNVIPKVNVTVSGYRGIERFSDSKLSTEDIILPEVAKAYHVLGYVDSSEIIWNSYDKKQVDVNGILIIEGKLKNTPYRTSISIRISDDIQRGNSISQLWTGSNLPAAIASHTNKDYGGVQVLNDTVIDFNSHNNMWTNQNLGGRTEDWVGILFADAGVITRRYVDNMSLGFLKDAMPQDFIIETFNSITAPILPQDFANMANEDHDFNNNDLWDSVSNPNVKSFEGGRMETINFDGVMTYALRIKMFSNKAIKLTELSVLESKSKSLSSFDIVMSYNDMSFHLEKDSLLLENIQLDTISLNTTNNASITKLNNNDDYEYIIVSEDKSHTKIVKLIQTQGNVSVEIT
ncbi:MAG: DUF4982 domain-containing protein [Erysipelothrix sp.]|nr:DUF4982 domain-containing protein [Erysipelothrix sp.]